jgi:hypothetical protein
MNRKGGFMYKKTGLFLVMSMVFFLSCQGGKATLSLEKNTFACGEEIKLSFTAPANFSEQAWVGIIPSDVPHGTEDQNDDNDIAYQYLNKQTEGELIFMAPGKAGAYDLRMNDTDDHGKEVASVSFIVKVVTEGAELTLDKDTYAPGEEIRLTFTAPDVFGPNAWVGIIPSDVPHGSEEENDQHDISYMYLEKKTKGLFVFKAPDKPGAYDFRMHDTDDHGNEITYVGFTVE